MLIRRERPDDVAAIDEVHRQAFAGGAAGGKEPSEVGLVHALRADRGWVPALSLVAASALGIEAPDPNWGDHFQARPLAAYRPEVRGTFHYAAPFERL